MPLNSPWVNKETNEEIKKVHGDKWHLKDGISKSLGQNEHSFYREI